MTSRRTFLQGVLAFAVLAAFAAPARAQEGGRISRVILYPGSATVERAAQVAPGSRRVAMTGLPANFDLRTLRVEAGPGVQIGEVAVHDVARTEAMSGREAELEARIQAVKDQKAALEVEVKTAELVRDYLASLSNSTEKGGKPRPVVLDPQNLPEVLEAIKRGGGDAYGTIQRIEMRKRNLDKQIAAAERDLARLRGGARDARTLVISYQARAAGQLRASYQVDNAGWKPVYRASLDSQSSKVEIERQAQIIQRTGEDWRGVTLRLSTGQPRPAHLVDPQPWQLYLSPPASAIEGRGVYNALFAQAPARADKAARAPAAEEPAMPAQFHTEYTSEYEVAGRVDLPADGRQVTVSLAREEIAVKQHVRIVPRIERSAMVTAEAALPEGIWIPGDVQLYRDGSYVGQTHWQALAKERLELPFGRDDRITVSVKRLKNRTGNAGILGTRNERQVADLYTVTSRHKVPFDLLLLEASPIGVSDDIKVDAVFDPQPKIVNWQEQRGVMGWEQPLRPGESLKFVADYTITYPKGAPIVGLP